MKARYHSRCADCGGLIRPGDNYKKSPTSGKSVHEFCPDKAGLPMDLGPEPPPMPVPEPKPRHEVSHVQVIDDLTKLIEERLGPSGLDENRVKELIWDHSINENTVKSLLAEAGISPEVNRLLSESEDRLRSLIEARGAVTVRIEKDGETIEVAGVHLCFPSLAYLAGQKRNNVYLWGPSGGFKSTAAAKLAESLGRRYWYISLNPMSSPSCIMGFIDAMGVYRGTGFRQAWEHGGVACIEELDNSSASFQNTLNTLLENGLASFPDAMVVRHPDFVLVATGNTPGRGATPQFPERRPFDNAFGERFYFVFWPYDEKLERSIALAINDKAGPWIDYVQRLREWAASAMPRLVVSPRASFRFATYVKDGFLSVEDMLEGVLFKGLDPDAKKKALGAVKVPSG